MLCGQAKRRGKINGRTGSLDAYGGAVFSLGREPSNLTLARSEPDHPA